MQFVKTVLPAGELESDGQVMHVELAVVPTAVVYVPAAQTEQTVPATHAVQVPPSGPVHPTLQVQFVKAALPKGELESVGQVMHVELAEAPSAVE